MIHTTFDHFNNNIVIEDAHGSVTVEANEVGGLIAKLTELRVNFPVLPRPAMLEEDFAAMQEEESYADQSWGH